MTNHIDQLAQWWHDAEEGIGKAGDVVIERDDSPNFETASYVVFTLGRDEHENLTYRRILARAPEPKPAWHDALAVIATWNSGGDGEYAGLWTYNGAGMWVNARGAEVHRDYLTDVTPLIEAKVTDEMVERGRSAYWGPTYGLNAEERVRAILAAAFGLEEGDL